MTNPTPSSTPTPIHSLLRSATRPTSSNNGYLILLQHAQTLHNRIQSSFQHDEKEAEIHSLAGIRLPHETALRTSCGFLLQNKLGQDIMERMNGMVVRVYTLPSKKEEEVVVGKKGVVVDLYSDPLGWDDDDDEEEDNEGKKGVFKCSNIRNLELIASTIEKASSSFSSSQCIPILFDSIQPILSLHGICHTSLLLSRLRNGPPKTNNPKQHVILCPILSNLVTPPEMRNLEDTCNAVLTMEDFGELRIVRKSNATSSNSDGKEVYLGGRLVNEMQPFTIEQCEDGYGYKFVFLSGKEHEEREEDLTEEMSTKLNIQNYEDGSSNVEMKNTTKKKKKITLKHEEEDDKNDVAAITTTKAMTTKGPRIYMQDDDPEFDDLDEEDPDDDLDI